MTDNGQTPEDDRSREADTPAGGRGAAAGSPAPQVASDEVIGLLAYLDARGGSADIFQVASELGCPWETVVAAAKAAELLGMVSTPGPTVLLEPEGWRFLRAPAPERAAVLRKRQLRQRCFREVRDALMRPGRRVDRRGVLETLRRCVPAGDPERWFPAFVDWGRRGALFTYAEDARLFSL